jgi:hypothetical protein
MLRRLLRVLIFVTVHVLRAASGSCMYDKRIRHLVVIEIRPQYDLYLSRYAGISSIGYDEFKPVRRYSMSPSSQLVLFNIVITQMNYGYQHLQQALPSY